MIKTLALVVLIVLASIASTEGWAKGTTHRMRQSSQLQMTLLTYQGKTKDFPAGSPLSKACATLGVSPKYNCRK
jgi:hypothetical protein